MKLFLDFEPPNWNEYINAERANKFKANSIKQAEKDLIRYTIKTRWTGSYPVTLTIRPHFKNKKRDLDNFRMKGLIDGLVAAGVLKNDNLTCIDKIILEPIFDNIVGVEIEITETKGGGDLSQNEECSQRQ